MYYILPYIENQQLKPDTCFNGGSRRLKEGKNWERSTQNYLGTLEVFIKEDCDLENEEQFAGFELEVEQDWGFEGKGRLM